MICEAFEFSFIKVEHCAFAELSRTWAADHFPEALKPAVLSTHLQHWVDSAQCMQLHSI